MSEIDVDGDCEDNIDNTEALQKYTTGFVLHARLVTRGEKILMVITALERNKIPGTLPPLRLLPLNTEPTPKKLRWQQRQLKPLTHVDPVQFVSSVRANKLMAVVRASEHLESLLNQCNDRMLKKLFWNVDDDSIARLSSLTGSVKWTDLIRMILCGTFKQLGTRRDLDQTMTLRRRFWSTELLKTILSKNNALRSLTQGEGLGGLLFFFLTGQSSTTQKYLLSTGFPTSAAEVVDSLKKWKADDGPFENMNLYGTANSLITFVVGGKTQPENLHHISRIESRFRYYFSQTLQTEWLNVLGDVAHVDLEEPNHPQVKFESMLGFWRRLFVVYGIWGLGSGLLPLQMTISLAEVGLVAQAPLEVMAEFVSQTPRLGASRALLDMGFPIDIKHPTTAALAFCVSYRHVRTLLERSGTDFKKFRYEPVDHEHMLCKVSRTSRRLREAFRRLCEAFRNDNRLVTWASNWLPPCDASGISKEVVAIEVKSVNRECTFCFYSCAHFYLGY